jgi:membrane protease YdiL (CAAX protease family)
MPPPPVTPGGAGVPDSNPIDTPADWLKLLAGFLAVFACFQVAGGLLGSERGQHGLLIGVTIVAATVAVECALFGSLPQTALRKLGLGAPTPRGMLAAGVAGVLLVLTLPAYARLSGEPLFMQSAWPAMLPGLFMQAGVAEEVLFRGYLFRRLLAGRSFWPAALLSVVPFAAAHLVLFLFLPWPVALASLLLASAVAVPLAHLFVIGGCTIWAPALLHFVIQGAIKVVAIPPGFGLRLPIIWIAASAVVPFLVLLVPRQRARRPVDGEI